MKLAVWYHCKISGLGIPDSDFALSIVAEQMQALRESGLSSSANEIHFGVNGDSGDALLVAALAPDNAVVTCNPPGYRSELPTFKRLRQWLADHREWLVCYHHSKGVTGLEQGRRDAGTDDYKAHHRRTMEHYVIRNWRQCVADLERGYQAVGCNWVDPVKRPVIPGRFFAGNFWWARADYLLTLPPLPDNAPDYSLTQRIAAESWIGSFPGPVRVMDYERPSLYA